MGILHEDQYKFFDHISISSSLDEICFGQKL